MDLKAILDFSQKGSISISGLLTMIIVFMAYNGIYDMPFYILLGCLVLSLISTSIFSILKGRNNKNDESNIEDEFEDINIEEQIEEIQIPLMENNNNKKVNLKYHFIFLIFKNLKSTIKDADFGHKLKTREFKRSLELLINVFKNGIENFLDRYDEYIMNDNDEKDILIKIVYLMDDLKKEYNKQATLKKIDEVIIDRIRTYTNKESSYLDTIIQYAANSQTHSNTYHKLNTILSDIGGSFLKYKDNLEEDFKMMNGELEKILEEKYQKGELGDLQD